jgi:RNA polymerase-binding transcription factor DksA
MGQVQQQTGDEKTRLIEKRNELRARLAAIKADIRRGLEPDLEERAIQLQNDEVLAGIANATAMELENVEARLAEISR